MVAVLVIKSLRGGGGLGESRSRGGWQIGSRERVYDGRGER
jgi:hypothetical protein